MLVTYVSNYLLEHRLINIKNSTINILKNASLKTICTKFMLQKYITDIDTALLLQSSEISIREI